MANSAESPQLLNFQGTFKAQMMPNVPLPAASANGGTGDPFDNVDTLEESNNDLQMSFDQLNNAPSAKKEDISPEKPASSQQQDQIVAASCVQSVWVNDSNDKRPPTDRSKLDTSRTHNAADFEGKDAYVAEQIRKNPEVLEYIFKKLKQQEQ